MQTFERQKLLRLNAIIGPNGILPISRSSWYAGIRAGRFPKPLRFSARTSMWRAEDIWALIEKAEDDGGAK